MAAITRRARYATFIFIESGGKIWTNCNWKKMRRICNQVYHRYLSKSNNDLIKQTNCYCLQFYKTSYSKCLIKKYVHFDIWGEKREMQRLNKNMSVCCWMPQNTVSARTKYIIVIEKEFDIEIEIVSYPRFKSAYLCLLLAAEAWEWFLRGKTVFLYRRSVRVINQFAVMLIIRCQDMTIFQQVRQN